LLLSTFWIRVERKLEETGRVRRKCKKKFEYPLWRKIKGSNFKEFELTKEYFCEQENSIIKTKYKKIIANHTPAFFTAAISDRIKCSKV